MKILFFFLGHRQMEEYKIQSFFINKFKFIKDFDVIIYSNSNQTEEELRTYCQGIPNIKEYLTFQRNTGYVSGLFTGLAEHFEKFKEYDFVVHLHPDVFIYDDSDLYNNLRIMDWLNFDLLTSPSLHTMKYQVDGIAHGTDRGWNPNNPFVKENCFHATDIFVFNPSKIDVGFFDSSFHGETEHIFTHNIYKYNLKVLYWSRPSKVLEDMFFTKDSCGIWHSHDLNSVRDSFGISQ